MQLNLCCSWRYSLAAVACALALGNSRADSFTWFQGVDGSFNDPNGWCVDPFCGSQNPNPDKKIPGASDDAGFTRGGLVPVSYTVNLGSGAVGSLEASSYVLPALTQPLTLNVAGTITAGLLDLEDLVFVTGGGEISGGLGSALAGVTVTGGTTVDVSGGTVQNLVLLNAKADLEDVSINTALQLPLQGLILTNSILETGGNIQFGIGAGAILDSGSIWTHTGTNLAGTTFKLSNGSYFTTSNGVSLLLLTLDNASSFKAGAFTHTGFGFSMTNTSSLKADSVFLTGGLLKAAPALISDLSALDASYFELQSGWLRLSSGSKLRTGTPRLGSVGDATIIVTDPHSEWSETDQFQGGNIQVLAGGSVLLGGALVSDFSAMVDGKGSTLNFIDAYNAALTVSGGASATGTELTQQDASGASRQPGSSLNLSGLFEVGADGSANFDISEGGYVECGTATLGSGANGNAMMTVAGSGSEWLIHQGLVLGAGETAKAALNISQGALVTVGSQSGGTNIVSIGDGSQVTVTDAPSFFNMEGASSTIVGAEPGLSRGPATLTISAGAKVNAQTLVIGPELGGEGVVTAGGTGSRLDVQTSILVGTNEAKGTLNITNAAVASAARLEIGLSLQDNRVLVSGAGSSLSLSAGAVVGETGTGTLTVAGGARLTFSGQTQVLGLSAGAGINATGTLVVDGDGSTVAFPQDQLIVGFQGTGTLTISSGGQANLKDCYLGYTGSSTANALVTGKTANGTRSLLNVASSLNVGGSESQAPAVAALDVNNSGYVFVGDTMRIRPKGSVRLNGGSIVIAPDSPSDGHLVLAAGGTLILEGGAKLVGALNLNGGTLISQEPLASPFGPSDFQPGPGSKSLLKSSARPLTSSPVGTIIQGDLVLGSGTFEIDLAGPRTASQPPLLTVTGTVALGGTLSIQFTNGFAPAKGETLNLFNFESSITGQFATVQIGGLAPGFQYDLQPNAAGSYTFTALNDGIAISPPLLNIVRTGNQVQISWPATVAGFTLQGTTNLSAPVWETVPVSGSSVVLPLADSQGFFRLAKP